ncbi:MAG TPA: hypothetical protein VE081_03635 [Sporichthyaceae bacterium]|nr:hypothetical protein [Sporichthyaceae bacterium]
MLVLAGLICVLTGSFLAIIGMLGAVGAGLQLRLLPGRAPVSMDSLAAAAAKPGSRVVVRGTVAAGPGGTVRAPLSGRDCVWYLASQSATDGAQRSTVERYSAEPFVLQDATGRRVLVGPVCPALEQLAPSYRAEEELPHPWFDEAPATPGAVQVLEFSLTGGEDLLAAGEVSAAADGTPVLGGEVTLSGGGDAAAFGDPLRRTWQRDLTLTGAGVVLIAAGSLMLSAAPHHQHQQTMTNRQDVVAIALSAVNRN